MGNDNLFHKHRESRKKREFEIINQRPNRWLIVTEGTKTEPIYFGRIVEIINDNIEKDYALKCDIYGLGMNTVSLVKMTDKLQYKIDCIVKKHIIPYDKIFVVFDRDSFSSTNFNDAISMCRNNGYIPLWSNEAIEYWFLLHFNYYNCSISRTDYKMKLEGEFKAKNINKKYEKNNVDIVNTIINYGSLKCARRNSLKVYKIFESKKISFDKANSCTTLFRFFDEVDNRNEILSLKSCDEIFK